MQKSSYISAMTISNAPKHPETISKAVQSEETASAVLEINLDALAANYNLIKSKTSDDCVTAGVVKANGYGLGADIVSDVFYAQGCRDFYVATLDEALSLRKSLASDAHIYVFGGLYHDQEGLYTENSITPVLNSLDDIKRWQKHAENINKELDALIHIDTAMSRLGLDRKDVTAFCDTPTEHTKGLNIQYVISHFASADDSSSALTEQQYERFSAITSKMGTFKRSLANSSGTFRDNAYHFDMVRPGMALYGLNPMPEASNPMFDVVSLKARILQTREAEPGDTVGYNATYNIEKPTKIATVALGYADGILRNLSNQGHFYWKGTPCPVLGRISMDLITVDISNIEDRSLHAGAFIEVLGPHQSADALAKDMQTIGYEVLTSLGARYARKYTKKPPEKV